ncbi:glycosyltransferase [Dehalobacter sp. DCM]|uniref:MGDG synthase family glycosyltransferase n=1 Tax=Dehalobacter sp. DCM TaxID=2907827 RepID=UPI003081C3E1|nr:glycosyltransferase [Dehalobacter sp. DCM]
MSGILIFSSQYGEGHFQAGEALTETLRMNSASIEAKHLDFGSFFFIKDYVLRKAYSTMIKKTPKLWRVIFEKTSSITAEDCRKIAKGMEKKKVLDQIWRYEPEVIVSTHFIPAAIMGELKLKGLINVPLVTVVTDYLVHGLWIHSGTDKYIVGDKNVGKRLMDAGVATEKIMPTGIPIRPSFSQSVSKTAARQKLALKADGKTILVMGLNGKPVSSVEEIRDILYTLSAEISAQFLVVCGSNKELYSELKKNIVEDKLGVKLFGHVENVQELMAASDLLITKGGALTISEAIAMGLPMLMYKPIPGHEKGNALFIEAGGAGKMVETTDELIASVVEWVNHPEQLVQMSLAARRVLPANPTENAVNFILQQRKTQKAKGIHAEAIS